MMSHVRKMFQDFFCEEKIFEISRVSGLVERSRKFRAIDFLASLCFWDSDSIDYFEIAASQKAKISVQAVAEKMKKADVFFSSLAKDAMRSLSTGKCFGAIAVPGVGNIFLADSSTISLRNSLAKSFPSVSNGSKGASVKLHAVFNVKNQSVDHLSLDSGKTSEHEFKELHRVLAKPGDLLLRDMGYFDGEDLKRLEKDGIFFISRIPLSVTNFEKISGEKFDVWKHLEVSKKYAEEFLLSLGKQGFPCRVIAKRLPRQKWKEKEAQSQKEKKRSLTKLEKTQIKWGLMITNLPDKIASLNLVVRLYAIRWQIELLFKAMKSHMGIDRIKNAKCEKVVRAFIWARLLWAIVAVHCKKIAENTLKINIPILRWTKRFILIQKAIYHLIQEQDYLNIARYFQQRVLTDVLTEKSLKKSSIEKVNDLIVLRKNT